MKKKPAIGIIGAGMIGDIHLRGIRKDGRAEVTWIASESKETLDEKKKKFKVPNCTLDYTEILGDPDVDAVIICTPPYLHYQMSIDSIKAGKHVLIEKPIVSTAEDLKKLTRFLQDNKNKDLIIMEPSFRHARLSPKFAFIKSLIDNGLIGDVYHIHHNHLTRRTYIEYNPRAHWSLDKKKSGGGPLLDWGVYDLSFHLGLLDDKPQLTGLRFFLRNGLKKFKKNYPSKRPPAKQEAFSESKEYRKQSHQSKRTSAEMDHVQNRWFTFTNEVEEHGAVFMEFTGGLTYYYERGEGVQCEVENETRIYGTKGYLKFGYYSWQSNEIEYYYADEDGTENHEIKKVDLSLYDHDNWAMSRHFVDCLLGKAEPLVPIETAIKNLEILFRIV